jgi:predicted GIY-YIG superfamily endonuclease
VAKPHARKKNLLRIYPRQLVRHTIYWRNQSSGKTDEATQGTRRGGFHEHEIDRLLYWESYDDVRRAIDREKQLKGWRREKKIALIESLNPHWLDLSKTWCEPSVLYKQGKALRSQATEQTPLSTTK